MRLIDADALKANFQDELCGGIACYECSLRGENGCRAERWIDIQPTVEAVPIVRCADCKYWVCIEHEGLQHTACKLSENPRAPEYLYHPSAKDFCSRGERKDEVKE